MYMEATVGTVTTFIRALLRCGRQFQDVFFLAMILQYLSISQPFYCMLVSMTDPLQNVLISLTARLEYLLV